MSEHKINNKFEIPSNKRGILSSYPWDGIKIKYALVVIDGIQKYLPGIKTIYDIGCGTGVYIQELINRNLDCIGFELSPQAYYDCKTNISLMHQIDVSKPIRNKQRDLVLSIEVAEHIEPDLVDIYIDNLKNLSSKYIYITSSDKPGKHHVNPQPSKYWIDKVTSDKQFKFCLLESVGLMSYYSIYIKENTLLWFKDSVMIFERVNNKQAI